MPNFFQPLKRPLCQMVLLCAIFAGCAGPSRTFVSEENTRQSARTEPAAQIEQSTENPSTAPIPPTSAPNHPEPSVWSKWVGALVPARPKPTQRIPLPRTDKQSESLEEFQRMHPAEF